MIEINENWCFESAESGEKVLGAVIYRPGGRASTHAFRAVCWGQRGGRVSLGPYKAMRVMVIAQRPLLVETGAVMEAAGRENPSFADEGLAIEQVLATAVAEGRF